MLLVGSQAGITVITVIEGLTWTKGASLAPVPGGGGGALCSLLLP
jgi:hypothetical protein